MQWIKQSRIFNPEDNPSGWITSYASQPVVDLNGDCLRIYFATRDKQNRSLITYLDTDPKRPERIRYIHDRPILELGLPGTFDDNGMMPSSIVHHDHCHYLYYMGWNPQITTSYRLAIGLAISEDGGQSYQRFANGPLLDRSLHEPYYTASPEVLKQGEQWQMWYLSCTTWEQINNHPEPHYHIKLAHADDGIHWQPSGITCIDYDDFTKAIARPCVYLEGGLYKMIYSYRNSHNYRTDPRTSYRLGYAESVDGQLWTRKDAQIGIERAKSGWDSMMIEYASTYVYNKQRYLIYNGNSFGKSGFGYAIQQPLS